MKEQGLSFDQMFNLDLSQNFIVTDFGKLILCPFKVRLTSFQSISIISQILFLVNIIFSEVSSPVILNK